MVFRLQQNDALLHDKRATHIISNPPVCVFFVCRVKILFWTSVNLVNTENLVQPLLPFLSFFSLKPAYKWHFCASYPSDIQILDDMDPWPWSRGPIASRPWVNYISTNGNRIRLVRFPALIYAFVWPPCFFFFLPPQRIMSPQHKRSGTLSSTNEKAMTINSDCLDEYPGFPKVASPGIISSREDSTSSHFEDLEPTIPPTHKHRTVILCFDGTGMLWRLRFLL